MNHSDLVDIGYKWALKRCGFAFKEFKCSSNEIPDVLGFRSEGTFLLEAKVSRQDFLKDKNKHFRLKPEIGVGDWRFFIVPVGLIHVEELPYMWGLLEVDEKGKVIEVYNPFGKGNVYNKWERHTKNIKAENKFMYSALRRLQIKNRIEEIYE